MKESFEQAVQAVSKVAKEGLPQKEAVKEIGRELKMGEKDLSELIPFISRADVLELQKEKQKIVSWLHAQFDRIDHNESVESFSYNTIPYVVDAEMEATLPGGKKEKVLLEELLTDGEWGIEYKLLPEVSRETKKQYVLAEAERHITKLLDRQAGTIELQKEIPQRIATRLRMHLMRRKASYESVLNRNENDLPIGIIAERMVKTYFEKFQMNNDAPFVLREAGIKDDVERKIDFFLEKSDRTRGVSVEEPTERRNVGIQLLSMTSDEFRRRKLEQIEHSKRDFGLGELDDLVLVELSLWNTKNLYKKWLDEGKKPGGPAKLWSEETEKEVFYGILKEMFTDAEIDEMWENGAHSDTR